MSSARDLWGQCGLGAEVRRGGHVDPPVAAVEERGDGARVRGLRHDRRPLRRGNVRVPCLYYEIRGNLVDLFFRFFKLSEAR